MVIATRFRDIPSLGIASKESTQVTITDNAFDMETQTMPQQQLLSAEHYPSMEDFTSFKRYIGTVTNNISDSVNNTLANFKHEIDNLKQNDQSEQVPQPLNYEKC